MIKLQENKMCCGCSACQNVCPKNCVRMEVDKEGFYYPVIDESKCINCGLCEKVCSVINDSKVNSDECYAAYNKEKQTLLDSSSGGIFDLLARRIFEKNGVVYGAAFNEENLVEHVRICDVNDLYKLRNSKYVQSNASYMYRQVKEDLIEGRVVLFTGTGCQINSLNLYLKTLKINSNNLYTFDIICHGVPSPKVWNKYLKENGVTEKININFRDKYHGWEKYSVRLNDKKTIYYDNNYMISFLSECNIRPSCFDCKSKDDSRSSDITIGDFWGVKDTCPEMYKINGTSAVIIHSEKGKQLFDEIKEDIVYKKVELKDITKHNPAYNESVKENKNRKKFFKNLDKYSMDKLVNKYCKPRFLDRLIRKIKRVLKKIKQLVSFN